MKKILLLAICIFACCIAPAQEITLEDIVAGRYSQKGIRGIRPLADGESFSQISPDGKQILRC